jgi:murein L,D-transpeptidase YcbB/YkuD
MGPQMRLLLLSTAAVAMAVMLCGTASAESQLQPDATALPHSPTISESTFSKDTREFRPFLNAEDAAFAEQLRDLIENKLQKYVPRQQDRAGIEAFYRHRAFEPLWVNAGKTLPRAQQAVEFLRSVAADGLDPEDYPTPQFAEPTRLAADELVLTNSVATFVRHASTGRLAFTQVSDAIYFDLRAPDGEHVLEDIASSGNVRATLDGFNPQHPQYKALKTELALARRSQGEPADAAVGDASPGSKDRTEPKSGTARLDTLLANMERWRWLPHELSATYVMVNVPDYTLKVVNLGRTAWSTRIVVGRPGEYATPLLAETMKSITINPTWNVPPSIIRNEYLPALARDPNALARVGLKIEHDRDGSIHVSQPPGERNALGRIRFNFPNRFLVYQHDTPNKNLFDKTSRAYSHGCMRVQYPDQYAEVLLRISQPEDGYTAQSIRSLYGRSERNVGLKNPIPVYITYQTAFVDDDNQLQIRRDIYGIDRKITNLLKGDSEVADIAITHNHPVAKKPVMAHVLPAAPRKKATANLSAAHAHKIPSEVFGWESRWDNYFQSRRSAYEPFGGFRAW